MFSFESHPVHLNMSRKSRKIVHGVRGLRSSRIKINLSVVLFVSNFGRLLAFKNDRFDSVSTMQLVLRKLLGLSICMQLYYSIPVGILT